MKFPGVHRGLINVGYVSTGRASATSTWEAAMNSVSQVRFNRFRRGLSPIWMEALERRRLLAADLLLRGELVIVAPPTDPGETPPVIVESELSGPTTVIHQFGPQIEGVQVMARQGDKVVGAVYFKQPDADPDLWLLNQLVARFNSDGTLDATFGENGVADLGAPIYLTAITALNDGSIIVSGYDGMINEPKFTVIK